MTVLDLWLPILVAGLAVHVASFVAWTILPHHKAEWGRIPDPERFDEALKKLDLPPGNYTFPYAQSMDEMKQQAYLQRFVAGPTGTLSLWEGDPKMGRNIACTLGFFLAASFCLGYLATLAVVPGADFLTVFRFVTTAGILTFCAAGIPNAIWFRWKIAWSLVDGLVFAMITGLIFALLWPAAV
jgi:hypothetical protein